MLKELELNKSISKEEYKKQIEEMFIKISDLQRKIKDAGIPAVIVFEGWDAAGKGTLINKVLQALDPRGFNVYPTHLSTENEKLHPFLWRFWIKTPSDGRIVFFDRSWYRRLVVDKLEYEMSQDKFDGLYDDIINFERQLTDSGCIVLKFFLHISKNEQKKRFKNLENDPSTVWRVTKNDWNSHERYKDYLEAYDDMINRTNRTDSPWIVIEATDRRFAEIKIFNSIINVMEKALKSKSILYKDNVNDKDNILEAVGKNRTNEFNILDKVDLSLSISDRQHYKTRLKQCQDRLRELEHEIYKKRIPVIALYEGWDAAGKGGNIRRFVESLDPRGYEVVPIAAPNDYEKSHHYLWRFWRDFPKDGHITIFDRSWYGRVLVERVEGFCTIQEWKRAYQEINEMEYHLSKHGVLISKFWMHIDKDEQLKRFTERENTPEKTWKITQEDLRNREKWDNYKDAVNEMLLKTSTSYAPWTIIESNDKYYGRIKAYETVINMIEKNL